MNNSRVNDFFYSGNAVHGEPDYGLADNFVLTAEAFANTTYQKHRLRGREILISISLRK